MNSRNPLLAFMTLAVSFLLPAAAIPQGAQQTRPAEKPAAPSREASKTQVKPGLAEATQVSTEHAARDAARDATKGQAAGAPPQEGAESGVLEFRPAPETAQRAKEPEGTRTKDPALTKVHGTASSSAGTSGGRDHAASVGASTRSGKAHVYVETERSRATSPPPR